MKTLDVNFTTITIGSIMALIGIVLSIVSFFGNNKKEIQIKATDYALLKSKVDGSERVIENLRSDVSILERELREEVKRLDKEIIKKIDIVNEKMDNLIKLIIETKKT